MTAKWFEIETAEQAREAYEEAFGGWPYFLLMGADDDEIIWSVQRALRTGRELEADSGDER